MEKQFEIEELKDQVEKLNHSHNELEDLRNNDFHIQSRQYRQKISGLTEEIESISETNAELKN